VGHSGEVLGVVTALFGEPHRPAERQVRLVDLYAHQAAAFIEAARLHEELGNPLYLPWCLEGLAGVAATEGRAADAARLCSAREALLERLSPGLPPADPAGYALTLETVRAALGEDAFAAAHEAGRALTLEDAIAAAVGRP
jgi:hypothetical protein